MDSRRPARRTAASGTRTHKIKCQAVPCSKNSDFHRKIFLLLGLLQFVFPLLDAAMDAAQREEFFLVVNHLRAACAGERIILLQENGLLRPDFLAEAAEDAAEHVDLEFERHLLGVRTVGQGTGRAGRNNFDRLGWADEFAKLARDALGVAFLIAHEIWRPAVAFGHNPLFLGILHRHLLLEEMTERDFEPAGNRRQVKPFPKIQWFAFDDHFKLQSSVAADVNRRTQFIIIRVFTNAATINSSTTAKLPSPDRKS